jgi:abortive infection bacteriophage resistance protein
MRFEKMPTTPEEQAQKLLSRGLIAVESVLIQRLNSVSYYRISGYLHPFIKSGENGEKQYREGTTLDIVWNRYCFDRRLRLLVLDAVERIEVSTRAKLVEP